MPIDSADIEPGGLAGPARSFVDPDEVVAFALAINDHNPRYLDGTAVPPTYPVTPALPMVLHGLPAYPPAAVAAAQAIVHAEHDVVLRKPDDGDLLVEQHWVTMLIGGTADRGTAYAFEAHSGGATVLRHGRLEIRRA